MIYLLYTYRGASLLCALLHISAGFMGLLTLVILSLIVSPAIPLTLVFHLPLLLIVNLGGILAINIMHLLHTKSLGRDGYNQCTRSLAVL